MNANLSALTATAQCEIINRRLDCLLIMNKGVDSLFSLVPSLQTRKHLVYILHARRFLPACILHNFAAM